MSQRNVKLTIAYDGADYHGWQRQAAGIITVQEVLESTMVRVVNHPVKLRASGRTDTGVHAAGQVANFLSDTPIPDHNLPHALNSRLPADIRILKAVTVPDEFDANLSAQSKLYRYTVFNHSPLSPKKANYCYHYYHSCKLTPMQQGAEYLLGEHDFISFTGTSSGSQRLSTVRTLLRCQVFKKYHHIYFDLEGTGFLYHMVRNIVGTLLDIGRGFRQPDCIPDILNARDRAAAGPMAPPNGLSLQWVKY